LFGDEYLKLVKTSLHTCLYFRVYQEKTPKILYAWFVVLSMSQHVLKFLWGIPKIIEPKNFDTAATTAAAVAVAYIYPVLAIDNLCSR